MAWNDRVAFIQNDRRKYQQIIRNAGEKRDDLRLRYSNDETYMKQYLEAYTAQHGMEQSKIALDIALQMHRDQKRAEGLPYSIHPMMLAMHAISLGLRDDNLIAVMLLHDVCEDCPVCPEELPVNDVVRHGVFCITKTRREGETKKESMERYAKNIRNSKEACIAKVFDRCHNVSSMAGVFSDKRMQAYISETKEYIYPLITHVRETYPEYDAAIFALEYQMTSVIDGLQGIGH